MPQRADQRMAAAAEERVAAKQLDHNVDDRRSNGGRAPPEAVCHDDRSDGRRREEPVDASERAHMGNTRRGTRE